MNYMWTKCSINPDGSRTIPEELVERWTRQMNSSYKELPIEERDSDIRQAAKMMNELNVIYEIVME
ncbi:hypothetical protein H6G33_09950 [Calothrix sp. FACHB-1219]|nr:hypothetical protein [Calothrix sp. FACHB-168]MBD2217355.1 hypothetical protein [Calothrix sp. FACHB-1219]